MAHHARSLLAIGLFALTLTSAVACKDDAAKSGSGGGGGGAGKVASCNMQAVQSCREYRGGNLALGTDALARLCTGVTGAAFTDTPCPTDKVIGTCAKSEGKDYYYEGFPITPADNEQACKDGGGTFSKGK